MKEAQDLAQIFFNGSVFDYTNDELKKEQDRAKVAAIKHCKLIIKELNKLDYRIEDVFNRSEVIKNYKRLVNNIDKL